MNDILNAVKRYEQELRDGEVCVLFWRESEEWFSSYIRLDENDLLVPEDHMDILESTQSIDPCAVVLTYDDFPANLDELSLEDMAAVVQYHYEQSCPLIEDFIRAHTNLMPDLYRKVYEEQERYKAWLLTQPPSVILDHSYDYCVREEIVATLEDETDTLCTSQARALLSMPDTLGFIREEYERTDPVTMAQTWEAIQNSAASAETNQREMDLASDSPTVMESNVLALSPQRYHELKTQHPGKVAGVQVGKYMLFYGEDARMVAPALRSKVLEVEIPGMGKTQVVGSSQNWQAVLKKLMDQNIPVVLAQQDPIQGADAPYLVIQEREKVAADGLGYAIPPEANSFTIYQVKLEKEMEAYLFQSHEALLEKGLSVDPEHYEKVYTAPLRADETLEDIYVEFNIFHPEDYRGRSLSVSDVVVLHRDGTDTAYYCDMRGFQEVPEFLQPEPPEMEQEEDMEL